MKFQGFIGPAYTLNSVNVDCQACINLYPEINELSTGKGAEVMALYGTPGLELLATVGTGPIRLIHFDQTPVDPLNPTTRIFIASGAQMYKAVFVAGVLTATLLGTLDTTTGPVRAASSSTGLGETVFVDGANSYLFKKTTLLESFGTFLSFGFPKVDNATHVQNIDGYYVFNSEGTNQFFVSDVASLNIDPLSFASAEGDPDNIVGIIASTRDLILFNERTTEVFVNTGNADFPFERVSGGFIENGCVAPFSIAKIDGIVFWLGRSAEGQGVVFAAQGLAPQPISTSAIESAISTYANISTATAYTYQSRGHSFYVLNFDEATWVYDLKTRMWHERAYTNDGQLERHRGNFLAFIPEFGIHVVGDYANNKVYKFNENYYYDDTAPISCIRTSPHVSKDLETLFLHAFQLDFEAGVGLDGIAQGTDPQVMIQYSKDGGHSWSEEMWVSLGKIGEKKRRAILRRLGKFRDLVMRVKITDPVRRVLIGADLKVEEGVS